MKKEGSLVDGFFINNMNDLDTLHIRKPFFQILMGSVFRDAHDLNCIC